MRVLFFILTAFCVVESTAQNGYFKNYSEKDGLSNNQIKCFLQDKKGFVWIGTNYGLNKFDGTEFEKFVTDRNNGNSIASNNIIATTLDNNGNVWIATEANGIDMYDDEHKKFVHYTTSTSKKSLLENNINALFTDSKGNIWIGYVNKGWSKFNPANKLFEHYQSSYSYINKWGRNACNTTTGFGEDKLGNIWIASGYGLHKQTLNNEITTIIDTVSNTHYEARNLYLSVSSFSDSIVWLGTWAGGLKTYNAYTKKFTTYLHQPNFPLAGNKNIVANVAKKSDTELWIATLDKGLAIFNIGTKRFNFFEHNLSNAHSPLPNECRHLMIDNNQNLWAGFDVGFSLLIASHQNISVYKNPVSNIKSIPISTVTSIYHHSKNNLLYFGIDAGKSLYQQNNLTKQVEVLPTKGLLPSRNNIYAVNEIFYWNDDALLVNINDRYYLYSIATKKFEILSLQDGSKTFNPIGFASQANKENEIWITDYNNTYYKIKLGSNIIKQYGGILDNKKYPLPKGSFIAMPINDSLAWMYLRESNSLLQLNVLTNKYNDNFYNNNSGKILGPKKMAIDYNGAVWFTTYNEGLFKVWKDEKGLYQFEKFTEKEGLPDIFLNDIFIDSDNIVWITCNKGIICFNEVTKTFKTINDDNGLPEKCYVATAGDLDKNGMLYIGGYEYFYALNTKQYSSRITKPVISFKNFKILNQPWANDTININFQKQIKLNYKENFFSCELSVLDFDDTKNIQLEYRLEGLDKDWIDASNRRFISYSNLKSGQYTLLVKAKHFNDKPLSLVIIITPPFWQTWWFYLVILLTASIAIITFYRFRVNLIKKEEALKTSFNKRMAEIEMKALKAQMNPHFIFNSLNSINKYILKNDAENASTYLTKFAKLIRSILDSSEQNTVTLESELQLIRLYIEIEMLRFNDMFTYSINIDENIHLDNIQIPPMLIQPYVENAIWHGLLHKNTIGHLKINIDLININILQIVIEDNGVGRKKSAELKSKSALHSKSFGTKITDDRIHIANAQMGLNVGVELIDLYNENKEAIGTKVVLELGINSKNSIV